MLSGAIKCIPHFKFFVINLVIVNNDTVEMQIICIIKGEKLLNKPFVFGKFLIGHF